MARFKISIRDTLAVIAIVGLIAGWYTDRKRISERHENQVQILESKIARYEVVSKHAKHAKFELSTEDVFKALLDRVDLRTMVSGVRDVSVFGFEYDGKAHVTFNNGEKIVQMVNKAEFDEARKMLSDKID